MLSKSYKNIYENNALYNFLIGSSDTDRQSQATAYATILEKVSPECKTLLEIGSGYPSCHEKYFRDSFWAGESLEYYKLDKYTDTNDKFCIKHELLSPIETSIKFDAVIGFFNILSSIENNIGEITKKICIQALKNVYNVMHKGSVIICDYEATNSPYELRYGKMLDGNIIETTYQCFYNHPLSQYLRYNGVAITYEDEITVNSTSTTYYDRIKGYIVEKYHSIEVYVNGKCESVFYIEQPIIFACFTEHDIVEIYQSVGFSKILFFNTYNIYANSSVPIQLDDRLYTSNTAKYKNSSFEINEETTIDVSNIANIIVGIK